MTNPRSYNNLDVTPTQVARDLMGLARELANAVADFDQIEQDVVDTESAYMKADAKAKLMCRSQDDLPSADLRKAWCDRETEAEHLAYTTAKAVVRARKMKIDALKTRVTIGQTVCNAIQSEMDLQRLRSR